MKSEQPILFMMVGLPGSGKTTKAKELETEYSALRLTPDELILLQYGNNLDRPQRDAAREPAEALQWQEAKKALAKGTNVVLDWGFWSREERNRYRQEAESLGAIVKIIFLDIPVEKLWTRISQRPESLQGTLHITKAELEQWSEMFEPPTEEELK